MALLDVEVVMGSEDIAGDNRGELAPVLLVVSLQEAGLVYGEDRPN